MNYAKKKITTWQEEREAKRAAERQSQAIYDAIFEKFEACPQTDPQCSESGCSGWQRIDLGYYMACSHRRRRAFELQRKNMVEKDIHRAETRLANAFQEILKRKTEASTHKASKQMALFGEYQESDIESGKGGSQTSLISEDTLPSYRSPEEGTSKIARVH
ncbi:hypothetical protein Agabi119p4_3548 [Agaricus bisporus var. burnettii]|uniref:Uncharacterized protein n=1 Tax=Agaricus bisporus var. burnettii TaxID=192524 RepID=A0A8H7F4Y4_AGABI|nr:hypothetical protein Agabi119p4_3548 [Agaricus bisporus var. burnettii]